VRHAKSPSSRYLDLLCIFLGGGSLFAIHSECEVYNPRSERWTPIAPMLFRRSRSGVAGLDRLLYVVGGYDGAADLASTECYDYLHNKWTALTPMGTKRSCLGLYLVTVWRVIGLVIY